MRISLPKAHYAALVAAGITHPNVTANRWDDEAVFDTNRVSVKYLDKLHAYALKHSKELNGVLQGISLVRKVMKDPTGQVIMNLNVLVESALIARHRSQSKWLWDMSDGLPWLITGAVYTPRSKDAAASARISLKCVRRGVVETSGVYFTDYDLTNAAQAERKRGELIAQIEAEFEAGSIDEDTRDERMENVDVDSQKAGRSSTLTQLLGEKGYIFDDSPDGLMKVYQALIDDWSVKYTNHYAQYLYTTDRLPGDASDRYSRRAVTKLTGTSTFRVVNDLPAAGLETVDTKEVLASSSSDENDAAEVCNVPVHPWVYVFNLETHCPMWVWAPDIVEYVYDPTLVDKLIIRKEYKGLIKILTENPDTLKADFVAGKSGGTIIAALGPPGVGKSMSAEAYAESSRKILYRVQSDQLGISPEDIEKNLREVFNRAERWEAILLVDEADIYIRERGFDIGQNAIVGTLLRTLEWFNGTIFMTSNLGTIVDDAILSRCSAVIKYTFPSVEEALTIFKQFAELFGVDMCYLCTRQYTELGSWLETRRMSGRSIKNLLRLAVRTGKSTPTIGDLDSLMCYLPTEKPESHE